ncbi:MAG: hypothetical protein KF819_28155 [Labilithrix sp.]|nr:hypothetical protein [Labilithrix sp.]
MKTRATILALALALAGVTVAPAAIADASAPAQAAHVITISTNSQVTLDDLRIAAFNVREETYKDDKGADAKGLTAALHVFVRDDAAKNQKLRVHAGQTFSASGKTFEVVSIEKTGVKLQVK